MRGGAGLVVTSAALAIVLESDDLKRRFWEVASKCRSVVGCRMQPNQKALVVELVKHLAGKNVCTVRTAPCPLALARATDPLDPGWQLAIGDGANDEQMIRVADVGVGIRVRKTRRGRVLKRGPGQGVEGTTAVRASDYAISQFKYLKRLLLVHGKAPLHARGGTERCALSDARQVGSTTRAFPPSFFTHSTRTR